MVAIERHKTHSISWADLVTPDLDGALSFYGELMGWTSMSDGETPYYMLLSDGAPVAGAMPLSPDMGDMPPVWSIYVAVEDAAETLARARELGGQVAQEPVDIPDTAKFAVLVDPAGAALCLFEGDNDGFKVMDEPGAPCWFDCHSRNADAADAFYQALFGWSSTPMAGFPYRVMDLGGEALCGIMAMSEEIPAEIPSHWVINFSIRDVDRAAEFTVARGGSVVSPPQDTPYGRSCQLMDPWGATFMVIDRSSATEG